MAHELPDTDAAPASFGWGWRVALGVTLLVFSWMYARHPVGRFTRGGLIHGDGVYYYAYARSLVHDRDVDFENDYALLGNPHARPRTKTGLPENRFTIGPALLWTPSFLLAEGVVRVGAAAGYDTGPRDGSGPLQQRVTLYASLLLGFAAIVLSALLARRLVSARAAGLAALGILLASPLPWYMIYQPSWPHAASAFAVAAFVYAWHRGYRTRGTGGWVALGLLAGLMALVRPQSVVFTLLPAYELTAGVVAAAAGGRAVRGACRDALLRGLIFGLIFALAAALAFSPQMLAWWALFGAPLTIPQGADFMRWGASRWGATLFSSRNGLFAWTPIVYVAVLGLLAAALGRAPRRRGPVRESSTHIQSRRARANGSGEALEITTTTTTVTRAASARPSTRPRVSRRALAGLLLAVFALQCYINGSVDDWWGGWAYGGRRFLDGVVLFVLGLALALERVGVALTRRGAAIGAAIPGVALAGFAVCNLERMDDYLTGALERGESQAMQTVNERALSRWVERWYATLGHPGAAPASWLFSLRAGADPGRYDLVSGWELLSDRRHRRGWDLMRFPDDRWTMSGFGPQVSVGGQACSVVAGARATVAIPLRAPEAIELQALVRPTGPGARVELELNGGRALPGATLDEGWSLYRVAVPAAALRSGVNYARIRQVLPQPRPLAEIELGIGRTNARSPSDLRVTSDALEGGEGLRVELGLARFETLARGVTALEIERAPGGGGRVRALGTFDTQEDGAAAERFAAVIDELPEGTVVAIGFTEKARRRWSPAASRALASLGARGDLEADPRRMSYALIGVKGARPGAAIERRSRRRAAIAQVGRAPHERAPGICWAWMSVARAGVEPLLPEVPGRARP